jgi:hypothetical protein
MEYYTAIIFFPIEKEIEPRKYRNINDVPNFMRFAQREGATYINLYFKKTKAFYCRIWLN